MTDQHPPAPNRTQQELSTRQTAVLAHLLSGLGVEQAAVAVGVGERTVWTWLRENETFKAELRTRQRQAMEAATRKLQATAGKAVDALVRVMDDPQASHAAVVSAAKTVLDAGYRGIELADFLERLEALEDRDRGDQQS